ncbi:hypothetical protein [Chryseobacterium indoltheticum]|uniref:hypothetical protein n=1 Tax=Chryseobacterium indoltheticum TaxID=254 RepID=UPI003F493F1E
MLHPTQESHFQKNIFYEAGNTSDEPFIDIEIDDNSHHRFSSDGNQYLLVDNKSGGNTNYITQTNITNGFISYRDLLKLHFRQDNQEPDLVSLFLGHDGLFSDMVVPAPAQPENKIAYKNLWVKCGGLDQEALTDYNTNIAALFDELEMKANMLLAFFQKECSLKIQYTDGEIIDAALNNPAISFKVKLFGKDLPEHDDMLNEARLTAIAISVFLVHQLCVPPTEVRILFLDDIFIGLDMSNRIPLLKILTSDDLGDGSSFKGAQIFLTTYDREWFNVAKSYLEGWQKTEFYVDNHSSSVDRPLIRKSGTYKERAEFHFIQGDYPACANYLRKAFEQTLRNLLPENTLYVTLGSNESEGSQITISKEQLSMKETAYSWFFLPKTSNGSMSGSSLRIASLHTLIDMFRSLIRDYHIPFQHLEELIRIKNRLLNPLSHDDLKSPVFKVELENGFLIFDELLKVKSKLLIDISLMSPVFLFYDEADLSGNRYRYKFELMENLRYIEYAGTGKLLNAKCKPLYRRLISSNIWEDISGQNRKSVYDFCKAAKIYLTRDKHSTLDEASLLNRVFTQTGQPISGLI